MLVRHASNDDLPAVLDLHIDHGSREPGPPTEREQATWQQMMQRSGLTVYVAEHDGLAVGTASAISMPNVTYECAPALFIEAVVTRRSHRRQGIASAVIRRILDEARAEGCDKVQLLSHKRHATTGAHALYDSLGFTPEAEGFRLYLRSVR
jgi:GNAT superfamily N-acetyltransferase